uniref:(northern house mosquito) hypothetical protein n=1 Tax=Culex pipiens TaxID=7175 RepID=A0A8D8AQN4_CULPI
MDNPLRSQHILHHLRQVVNQRNVLFRNNIFPPVLLGQLHQFLFAVDAIRQPVVNLDFVLQHRQKDSVPAELFVQLGHFVLEGRHLFGGVLFLVQQIGRQQHVGRNVQRRAEQFVQLVQLCRALGEHCVGRYVALSPQRHRRFVRDFVALYVLVGEFQQGQLDEMLDHFPIFNNHIFGAKTEMLQLIFHFLCTHFVPVRLIFYLKLLKLLKSC